MVTLIQLNVYLSGLWLKDIYYGLLRRAVSLVFNTGDGDTGAPKWSWLSFPGMVDWPTRHRSMRPVLEIVDATSIKVLEEIPQVVTMFTRLKVRAKM
jgi:hypothetical protein